MGLSKVKYFIQCMQTMGWKYQREHWKDICMFILILSFSKQSLSDASDLIPLTLVNQNLVNSSKVLIISPWYLVNTTKCFQVLCTMCIRQSVKGMWVVCECAK